MESISSDEIIFEKESKEFYPDDITNKSNEADISHDDERIKSTEIKDHDENNNEPEKHKKLIQHSNNCRDNSIIGMLRSSFKLPNNKRKTQDKISKKDSKQDKYKQKSNIEKAIDELDDDNLLSDNKVNVDIVPDVEGNNVVVNLCSCSCAFNFSMYK